MTNVIQNYLEELQTLQNNILNYLEEEETSDNFRDLSTYLMNQNIDKDKHKLKLLLLLILRIANNYHRTVNFFSKIERVLQLFRNSIQNFFTQHQIFTMFRNNKRILLFFIEEKLITFDKYMFDQISTRLYGKQCYIEYFFPEIEKFLSLELTFLYKKYEDETMPESFNEKRKIGGSDNILCKMIQSDLIDDFIVYVTKMNLSLNSKIIPSIFETNNFLLKRKESSLIEYAAFFGSAQIFQYLRLNNVDIKPSIWLYAIHGKNAEIIHLIEENQIYPEDRTFKECFKESIKCHHNDIANYFDNTHNIINDQETNNNINESSLESFYFKYYNFTFLQEEFIDQSCFYHMCQYDYYDLVNILLKNKEIDVNMMNIFFFLFY